jgi:hypothetical protein
MQFREQVDEQATVPGYLLFWIGAERRTFFVGVADTLRDDAGGKRLPVDVMASSSQSSAHRPGPSLRGRAD